jgi:hypothetical protein
MSSVRSFLCSASFCPHSKTVSLCFGVALLGLLLLVLLLLILLLLFCVLNDSLHELVQHQCIIFILMSPCAIWNGVGPGGIIICC